MKYVWAFSAIPNEETDYPELYSSMKKAMYRFNAEYHFAQSKGINTELIRTDKGISASWIEGKGTTSEQKLTLIIEKLEVRKPPR